MKWLQFARKTKNLIKTEEFKKKFKSMTGMFEKNTDAFLVTTSCALDL